MLRAALVGLSGLVLAAVEVDLLRTRPPVGVILFGRNVSTPLQLCTLIGDIRDVLPETLVMVDQEGGRVARLRPPHWLLHPPARVFGELCGRNPGGGRRAAWITGALIGAECRDAGFDVVAAPVLDVGSADGHAVIGDRAFGSDPAMVAELGFAMAEGLLAAGVQPVGKHAPGHGRARADSHLELPELDDIAADDLVPFVRNAELPWMMTAHIRYASQDRLPATLSARVIGRVIRGTIGFGGVLVSDDLAMQALEGTPGERGVAALAAGCDVALHCSGVLDDTRDVLASVDCLSDTAMARLQDARELAAARRQDLNFQALVAERASLLAGLAWA